MRPRSARRLCWPPAGRGWDEARRAGTPGPRHRAPIQRPSPPGRRAHPDANLASRHALGWEDDPREDGPSPHRSVPRTVSLADVIARQPERRGDAAAPAAGG